MRRPVALLASPVLALGLLSGCASDKERYCEAVEEHQTELSEITAAGGPAALLNALDIYRDLADRAPRDLTDEWDQVVGSLESLDEALTDAGVEAETYDPEQPPDGVTEAQQRAIADAASEVGSLETRRALAGVEQQARDVCQTPLSI